MIAASTAARMRPATNGCIRVCDITSTTVSGLSSSIPCFAMYAMPTRPEMTAPNIDTTIHEMPMRRALFASCGERSAMKRTIMCG